MKRGLKLPGIVLLLAGCAWRAAAAPYAGYLYPAGMQAGTVTRVLVGGQQFNGLVGAVISGAQRRLTFSALTFSQPNRTVIRSRQTSGSFRK